MNDEQELAQLVREALGENANKPFHPFAVYQSSLDTIFVIVKDCSHTERRINEVLAIHEDNYPEEWESILCRISNMGYSSFLRNVSQAIWGNDQFGFYFLESRSWP